MASESDDYTSDMLFGKWLRDQRIGAGLSLEDAALKAEIPLHRLKSLEMGLSERGINRAESEKLCAAYRIALSDLLARAQG